MNSNTWKHVPTLDKMHSSSLKFYLQDRKTVLQFLRNPELNNLPNRRLTLKTEIQKYLYHTVSKQDSVYVTNSIYFESEILEKDITISGNLSGIFNVSINKRILIPKPYYIRYSLMVRYFTVYTSYRASYAKTIQTSSA